MFSNAGWKDVDNVCHQISRRKWLIDIMIKAVNANRIINKRNEKIE